MPKKILFTASRASHIINFHLPYLQYFQSQGWQVHVLAQNAADIPYSDRCFDIPFEKKITSPGNVRTVSAIRQVLAQERYQIISTHATLAGFLTRLAVMAMAPPKPPVLYTVHGYLFSQRSPAAKKQLYLTAERLCRPATQLLMTMNQEDQQIAQHYRLSNGPIVNIPGMGLIPHTPAPALSRSAIRRQYGLDDGDVVALYAAEFSSRKNQRFLIDTLAPLFAKYPYFKLILAGDGDNFYPCQERIKALHLARSILTPGYISPIAPLFTACDLAISSSKSEGLPFNIMEAMDYGLPVLASQVKGHSDLIADGRNGYLFDLDNPQTLLAPLSRCLESPSHRQQLGQQGQQTIQQYYLDQVQPQITRLYQPFM